MEILLLRIYAGQKYPHIYTLSIRQESVYESTWCIIYSNIWYNYKVITDVTQYYKNITSQIGANAKIQRDI